MQYLAGYAVIAAILGAIGVLWWRDRKPLVISSGDQSPTIRELAEADPRVREVLDAHLYETILTLRHGQRAARWYIYRYLPAIITRRTLDTYGPAYYQAPTTNMEYPR